MSCTRPAKDPKPKHEPIEECASKKKRKKTVNTMMSETAKKKKQINRKTSKKCKEKPYIRTSERLNNICT